MKRSDLYDWVTSNCFTKDGRNFNSAFIRWCKDPELEEIKTITSDIDAPIGYRITKFLLDDIDYDRCVVCGCYIKPKPSKSIHCSIKCSCNENRTKRIKLTKLERYGDENYRNHSKIKETCQSKYGVDSPFHSKSIQDKIKQTCQSKYGVDNISQNVTIKQKIKDTRGNWSTEYRQKMKNTQFYRMIDRMGISDTLASKEWLHNQYITLKKTIIQIGDENNVSFKCVYDWLLRHDIKPNKKYFSGKEQEVYEYIRSIYDGEIQRNTRSVISPLEIDIYIPDLKLAIEFNGIYWHSYDHLETRDEKFYHYDKTDRCKDNDIKLIHLCEYDWDNKSDIIKSMLLYQLGECQSVIYARKCTIREIDHKDCSIFLDNTHLQGNCQSSIRYGLYYKDEIVSVMTFGKSRYDKSISYELIRYSTKKNTRVVGGASKLFSFFINTYNGSVISYSQRSHSNGNLYKILGFGYKRTTPPGYSYINKNKKYNRLSLQRHKLPNLLSDYDGSLSGIQNLFNNKFRRLWDSGNDVWIYNL